MRETSVNFARSVFQRHGLIGTPGGCWMSEAPLKFISSSTVWHELRSVSASGTGS